MKIYLEGVDFKILVGESDTQLGRGFAFNGRGNIPQTGRSWFAFINKRVKTGFRLVDSQGNEMETEWFRRFANHWKNQPSNLERGLVIDEDGYPFLPNERTPRAEMAVAA